jgi:uncharacterized damage-inducible protein DinB
MRQLLVVAALAMIAPASAFAQAADPRFFTSGVERQYKDIQGLILKTAEKVGEDLYSFKPTPEVRSLGGVLGHVADGNNLLCRIASGEAVDLDKIMKDASSVQANEKKTAKADIIAALNESRAFCESVFAKLTDAAAQENVTWFSGKTPKLMMLTFVTSHSWEHYGNLVTYMRLKGIVPPSSERPPSSGR